MKRHTAKVALFCLILSSACGEITPTSYNDPAAETFPVPTSKIAVDPAYGLHKIPLSDIVDTTVTGNIGWFAQLWGSEYPRPDKQSTTHFWEKSQTEYWLYGNGVWNFATWPSYAGGVVGPETLTTLDLWPLPEPDGFISCGGFHCEMDGSWSTAHESTQIESYRWTIVSPDSVEIWAQDEIKASYTFPDSLAGTEYRLCLMVTDGHGNELYRTIGRWTPRPARSSSGHSPGPPTPTQYTACDGDNVGTLDIHRPELPVPTITWNGYRIGASWDNPNVANSRVEYYEWGIDEISPGGGDIGNCQGHGKRGNGSMERPSDKK